MLVLSTVLSSTNPVNMQHTFQWMWENQSFYRFVWQYMKIRPQILAHSLDLEKTKSSWGSRCASRLTPSIQVLTHSGRLSATSELSRACLKTSLLLLSDGSLVSNPKGREGREAGGGRLLCFSHYIQCGVSLSHWDLAHSSSIDTQM